MEPKLKAILISATVALLITSLFYPVKGDITLTDGSDVFHAATAPYIASPTNITYNSGVLNLTVNFHAAIFGNVWYAMNYSLDGQTNQTLALTQHYFGYFPQTGGQPDKNYLDGTIQLPTLSNGAHSIIVYLECKWETGDASGSHMHVGDDSQTVYFTVQSSTKQSTQQTSNAASNATLPPPNTNEAPAPLTPQLITVLCVSVAALAVALLIALRKKLHAQPTQTQTKNTP
jgi:hypothetical protein